MLEQKDLSRLLETAIVAARLAGQRAMEEINYVKVSEKNADELVTEADARCQRIIIDRIKETYPDHGFVGEEGSEGKSFKQHPRGDEKIWWVIDPIDGTNNFAHQMPLFCVCIAVMYENEPVVGVVFEPATDRMYTAVKDGEAQLDGRRIIAGEDIINKFSSIGLDSHFTEPLPEWAKQMIYRTRFRNLGSAALQLGYVASGGMIASVSMNIKLWDIAAGALICRSAGAVVTDWAGNEIFPVDLDGYTGQRFNLLAANKKTHKELLNLMNS